jgi:hypothetical protein
MLLNALCKLSCEKHTQPPPLTRCPVSPDFYQIKDHKTVLEQKLSRYIVINKGTIITVTEGCITTNVVIEDVIDKHGNSIGYGITLNQDIETDFLPIPGYAEYLERKQKEKEEMEKTLEESKRLETVRRNTN